MAREFLSEITIKVYCDKSLSEKTMDKLISVIKSHVYDNLEDDIIGATNNIAEVEVELE